MYTEENKSFDKRNGDATMLPEYWGRWFVPIDGGSMHKINLMVIYRFASAIRDVHSVMTDDPISDSWQKLFSAKSWIETFLRETENVPMVNAKFAAAELGVFVQKLEKRITDAIREHKDERITFEESIELSNKVAAFEREFEHDTREINILAVPDVGTHATTKLLESAYLNVSRKVRSKLSREVIDDINAAGRCLALGSSTAAGFHILRAVEPLILAYHNKVTGITLPKKSRNWGAYILKLNKHGGGDPKVIGMVQHIKDFYRNPIMHPEAVLTPDEALALFYTCLSAIVQLDAVI